MGYGGFKDLNRRIVADKVLCDKEFNIANIEIWWIPTWTCFDGL